MMPRPAQYLLRFDDLCPTLSRTGWERFRAVIEEYRLKPILAVVPDNRDPELMKENPDADFWSRMAVLERAGATVALHGYRHVCDSEDSGILGLHPTSEFAGVSEDRQRQWIHEGLTILRGKKLNPKIWVAPRHGFDQSTLRALKAEGIAYVSDGFARVPFTHGGLTWIPQQLWAPVEKSAGLWTICIHSNNADDDLLLRLREFLDKHALQFTSLDKIIEELGADPLGMIEQMYAAYALGRLRFSRFKKVLRRGIAN
ncbi:MAG TPA: DUF2334 domain-containing protein [Terracidiphilus sp.]|jgi:hypothetical protein|nr:DUF2334 domain-containing protein [Terracidiphilus sp.]